MCSFVPFFVCDKNILRKNYNVFFAMVYIDDDIHWKKMPLWNKKEEELYDFQKVI